jgi:hypothetical protein
LESRNVILGAVLAFIAVLGVLTVLVAVRNGPDVLTVASLLVLGMFGFGIVGALRHPPHE